MTDVAIPQPSHLEQQWRYAQALAGASLLPEAYRKQPANVLLALEMASALGIAPMTAINGISVIKGKPTMSGELMRALVLRAGHMFKIDTLTVEGCRILAARAEFPDEVQEFTFTMQDAAAAGLTGSDTYKKHPKAMLLARCTTLTCRATFPDVIAGISYTPDELDDTQPAPRVVQTARLMPPADGLLPVGVVVDDDGVIHEPEQDG